MSWRKLINFVLLISCFDVTQCNYHENYLNLTGFNRQYVRHWSTYKYFDKETNNAETLVRHYLLQEGDKKSYILCPENYNIAQMAFTILANNNTINAQPGLDTVHFVKKLKNTTLPHHLGDFVQVKNYNDDHENPSICPSLKYCLFHQACLFNFGNEFCLQDPAPGVRKHLETNVTCVRRDVLSNNVLKLNDDIIYDEFKEKSIKVLQIYFRTKLENATPESVNLTSTSFKLRYYDPRGVFGGKCPQDPKEAGYKGECFLRNINDEEVIEVRNLKIIN